MAQSFKEDRKMYGRLFHPGLMVMAVYHFGNWSQARSFKPFRWLTEKIYWLFYHSVSLITAVHLPRQTQFGKKFHLIHPQSVIIHRNATFGDHVGIMHEVTIGNRGTGEAPQLGNHVFVGAGAKILGPITIGDHATIGAGTVVVKDVPAHTLVVGQAPRMIENHQMPAWDPEGSRAKVPPGASLSPAGSS